MSTHEQGDKPSEANQESLDGRSLWLFNSLDFLCFLSVFSLFGWPLLTARGRDLFHHALFSLNTLLTLLLITIRNLSLFVWCRQVNFSLEQSLNFGCIKMLFTCFLRFSWHFALSYIFTIWIIHLIHDLSNKMFSWVLRICFIWNLVIKFSFLKQLLIKWICLIRSIFLWNICIRFGIRCWLILNICVEILLAGRNIW